MEATQVSFTVLMYTSVIVILTVGGFLVKLLVDLSKLTKSATQASEVLQNELEPTLKELQSAAASVNSIVHQADEQITGAKKAITGAVTITKNVSGKVGGVFSGLVKGLALGLKLFRKK